MGAKTIKRYIENGWENQNIRLTAAFIAGIIIGFGGYWIYARPQSVDNLQVTADEEVSIIGDNGVLVFDQPAGNTVTITSAVLADVGWVAIHDNVNGAPGRILGATLFDKGTRPGTVELLRSTVAGTSYFAVIHTDDGDYKYFNYKTDGILNDAAGKPIMAGFKTTEPAATTSLPVSATI